MEQLFTVATDPENITRALNAYASERGGSERIAPLLRRVLAMEAIRKIGTFEKFGWIVNDTALDCYDAIRAYGTTRGYYDNPSKMQTWRELLEDVSEDVSAVH